MDREMTFMSPNCFALVSVSNSIRILWGGIFFSSVTVYDIWRTISVPWCERRSQANCQCRRNHAGVDELSDCMHPIRVKNCSSNFIFKVDANILYSLRKKYWKLSSLYAFPRRCQLMRKVGTRNKTGHKELRGRYPDKWAGTSSQKFDFQIFYEKWITEKPQTVPQK